MEILRLALKMLEKHPLCDHCLGRQFAMLGHGVENDERGKAIKLVLALRAHASEASKKKKATGVLNVLATNGFSDTARQILQEIGKPIAVKDHVAECFLCSDAFKAKDALVKEAVTLLENFEYTSYLVGTELPTKVGEREDEFRAEFEVSHGENMRNEFGRTIGKEIGQFTGKTVDFKRPEVVVLIDPFQRHVSLRVNPLFVSGRYRKLVRGIPQSKWFCSSCRGKGCEKCNGTGKMYQESVQEIIEEPFLKATEGQKSSFHASGREDIDARMLGTGRPFVIEITRPRKRFLDLDRLEEEVNLCGKSKVEVSNLKLADKDVVRRLKGGESTQKEYRVLMEFLHKIKANDLDLLEKKLTNAVIRQETPLRVLHRRADMTREKYIYEVTVKKMSPKKAEMKIRCQGGLYVKELVTGDEGRTVPSVSEILHNKAKPLKLDVLNIAIEDHELVEK
jgi:tRNA pseudouridine synthase 10